MFPRVSVDHVIMLSACTKLTSLCTRILPWLMFRYKEWILSYNILEFRHIRPPFHLPNPKNGENKTINTRMLRGMSQTPLHFQS